MIGNITYPYKTKYAVLPDNCKIAYIDEGKGKQTILFIHGLANYSLVWAKNIEYLKQYFRCIAIDLPGNGLSDKNEHAFTLRFFAESVYNFIQALGLKDVVIAGHSMGGQIAITTLLNYPGCAKSLVLCAPAGFEVYTTFDKTLYYSAVPLFNFVSSDEQNLRNTIEASFYRHHSQGEGMVKELISIMKTYTGNYYKKMVESCIRSMLEEPVYDRLGSLSLPVLAIFGTHDALIPMKMLHHTTTEKIANEAVKKIPNAILKMIPDCGHFVQWEKANEVNNYIVSFLGDDFEKK